MVTVPTPMNKAFSTVALLWLFVGVSVGQNSNKADISSVVAAGKVNGDRYENTYFGIVLRARKAQFKVPSLVNGAGRRARLVNIAAKDYTLTVLADSVDNYPKGMPVDMYVRTRRKQLEKESGVTTQLEEFSVVIAGVPFTGAVLNVIQAPNFYYRGIYTTSVKGYFVSFEVQCRHRERLQELLPSSLTVPHRTFIARVEPIRQPQAPLQETLPVLRLNNSLVTIDSVEPLRDTRMYVAIVIEGGDDRQFSVDVPIRFVKWFAANTNLAGITIIHAQKLLSSTKFTTDYAMLLDAIRQFKPTHNNVPDLWRGVLYACEQLAAVGSDENVRRLVLVITNPSPKGHSDWDPSAITDAAVRSRVVLVVEQTRKHAKYATGAALERIVSPGIVLGSDFTHGQQLTDEQFGQQTRRLSALLDELYLVYITISRPRKSNIKLDVSSLDANAQVYPTTLVFNRSRLFSRTACCPADFRPGQPAAQPDPLNPSY